MPKPPPHPPIGGWPKSKGLRFYHLTKADLAERAVGWACIGFAIGWICAGWAT